MRYFIDGAAAFAVVDVWDALTTDRPYRAAPPPAAAVAASSSMAGSHFDLAVIAAFHRLVADSEGRRARSAGERWTAGDGRCTISS